MQAGNLELCVQYVVIITFATFQKLQFQPKLRNKVVKEKVVLS